MIKSEIKDNLIRVIILDVSGIYSQIHNEGYFEEKQLEEIKKQYSNYIQNSLASIASASQSTTK